jgi:hypothetical protein
LKNLHYFDKLENSFFQTLFSQENTMKKTIIVTAICFLVFAGYIVGQNQTKEKHIENCCCKHTQQIAEDLHWIRTSMSKPFIPPPGFTNPGDFADPGSLTPIKKQPAPTFDMKINNDEKINVPKNPKRK